MDGAGEQPVQVDGPGPERRRLVELGQRLQPPGDAFQLGQLVQHDCGVLRHLRVGASRISSV
jgi:hypothetical protein